MILWAVIIGLIGIGYFVISYGIGYIPGMTGRINLVTVLAAIIGVVFLLYGLGIINLPLDNLFANFL